MRLPSGGGPPGPCLASLTPTPGPAAVPVGFAGVGCAAVSPPLFTVLPAQGRVQNPLRLPTRVQLDAGIARGKNYTSAHLRTINSCNGTWVRYHRNIFSYEVTKYHFTNESTEAGLKFVHSPVPTNRRRDSNSPSILLLSCDHSPCMPFSRARGDFLSICVPHSGL